MKIRPLFYLIVFSLFFISGLLLAMDQEPVQADPPSNSVIDNSISTTLPEKQLNILVIGVDEVGAKETELKAVWLILIPPGGDMLSFLPIYPQNGGGGGNQYGQPHEPVLLDASSLQSATKFDLLREQNTWWDEVVLLDEQGLIDLYLSAGTADFIQAALAEAFAPTGEIHSWEDPTAALREQASLIETMCGRGALFTLLSNGESIASPAAAHLMYSSNQVDMMEFLYALALANGDFHCQFPTLE